MEELRLIKKWAKLLPYWLVMWFTKKFSPNTIKFNGIKIMKDQINLLALQSFKLNELCKKEKRFTNKWVRNKSCPCVKDLRKDRTLNCKHIRKAINIEFKKEIDDVWNRTLQMAKNEGKLPVNFIDRFRT